MSKVRRLLDSHRIRNRICTRLASDWIHAPSWKSYMDLNVIALIPRKYAVEWTPCQERQTMDGLIWNNRKTVNTDKVTAKEKQFICHTHDINQMWLLRQKFNVADTNWKRESLRLFKSFHWPSKARLYFVGWNELFRQTMSLQNSSTT